MLYAAELPNKALDHSMLRSRHEVYCLELKEEAHDSETSISVSVDMDETIPFIPEICFHRVFSICVGMGTIVIVMIL